MGILYTTRGSAKNRKCDSTDNLLFNDILILFLHCIVHGEGQMKFIPWDNTPMCYN